VSGVISFYTIARDANNLVTNAGLAKIESGNDSYIRVPISMTYLDSPSTTSAITYQVYLRRNAGTAFLNIDNTVSSITCMEIKG